MASMAATETGPPPAAPYLFKRHALATRITHWVNALAIAFLIGTGLNIFNAHAALNLGKSSYNGYAPILEMKSVEKSNGELVGITNIFGREFKISKSSRL